MISIKALALTILLVVSTCTEKMPPEQFRKPCPAGFPVFEYNYMDVAKHCSMWGPTDPLTRSCTVLFKGVPRFRIMPKVGSPMPDGTLVTQDLRDFLDMYECSIVAGWDDK